MMDKPSQLQDEPSLQPSSDVPTRSSESTPTDSASETTEQAEGTAADTSGTKPEVEHETEQLETKETDGESTPQVKSTEEAADDDTTEDDGDDRGSGQAEEEDEDGEDEDDEEDEEPRLKYARLTQSLSPVYRNGDATSAFLVAGDKMIVGTHNGNIHIVQLPTFKTLRVYHAHSASVTCISISPYPPPLPNEKRNPHLPHQTPSTQPARDQESSPSTTPRKAREVQQIPRIPSNDIYIATSSMDGNVCIQSLLDIKDVQLRSFGRPVQAVALSPDFKNDRTYLTGGLAGQLVLTVGGGPGRSTSTTSGTAAATASGWLGSMGLGTNTGKDTILHSGEGTINCIKWSLSGKFVVWLNEHGIKIMRTKLHLESTDSEDAWKRIGHIDRPQTEEWETMASVWKGRIEWIDEEALEADEDEATSVDPVAMGTGTSAQLRELASSVRKSTERLLVGWGGTIWIVNVHSLGQTASRGGMQKSAGRAEIVKILRMDCIISGISLYTKNLLLVLAFCMPDDEEEGEEEARPTSSGGPSGGIRKRQNNPPPELRLIDLQSQAEVDKDGLSLSRYERLFAGDYHLAVLPARNAASVIASKGALETLAGLGTDMWNVATNPKSLFNSGASIRSRDSVDDASSKITSIAGASGVKGPLSMHPSLAKPGAKIFIHSPYDCILATKRDMSDHFAWLVEHEEFEKAWELLDENPDILASSTGKPTSHNRSQSAQQQISQSDDVVDEESVTDSVRGTATSFTDKEKGRIGELWIQQLIDEKKWKAAGEVSGKVLKTKAQWEKWVWVFAKETRFDEIADFMPPAPIQPRLPTAVYDAVLGHYAKTDKLKLRRLLDHWSAELYDPKAVAKILENQLKFRDVREDSVDGGVRGRDWQIVTESLAKLYEASGRYREALKLYIRLHNADSAFRLIRDNHLAEAVADDIPGFISLRLPSDKVESMTQTEIADATSEAIRLLVDEAQHGLVQPATVVEQLQAKKLPLYLFYYLRALWHGEGVKEHNTGDNNERLAQESKMMVDGFADLAVNLFAAYDRPLLMDMLKTSTAYTFEKAVQECEDHEYYDELIYLYSKTGQMKRALYLIIDRLKDVEKAIEFAKEQDDPDLWSDLLDYSMDKPSFIRALLEQVGTAINPITLVRRIPAGLEIDGLRQGLIQMMKEHELQHSISSGAARVLQSEVAITQNALRSGQKRGIKFEVPQIVSDNDSSEQVAQPNDDKPAATRTYHDENFNIPVPGHCAECKEAFTDHEMEALLGFSCGHIFHVSHLLQLLGKSDESDVDIGGDSAEGSRYLVGKKVMKARLLRDKVRGGCPLCHDSKDVV